MDKKAQKKKDREKVAKAKVLARRTAIRAESKKREVDERQRIKLRNIENRLKSTTVKNNNNKEEILNQIVKNLEILEFLKKQQEQGNSSSETTDKKSVTGTADVVFTPKNESNKVEHE